MSTASNNADDTKKFIDEFGERESAAVAYSWFDPMQKLLNQQDFAG